MNAVKEAHLPSGCRSQYIVLQDGDKTSLLNRIVALMSHGSDRDTLHIKPEKQTHVVTWIDPPCPVIGNFSRLHMVLYMMNVTDGRAAPRNTIAGYDGKPRDRSIQCNRKSGKKGIDRPSAGGGRDG